jgi:hypothetical protein
MWIFPDLISNEKSCGSSPWGPVCSGPWWTDGDADKGHGGASLARGARAGGGLTGARAAAERRHDSGGLRGEESMRELGREGRRCGGGRGPRAFI